MRTENRTKTARISLLTVVHFSTLVGCRVLLLHCEVVLSHHPPHHSQLVLTWAATSHGRHYLPQKVSMHYQHVVAGFWSCSISVAQWDREGGEGEENQEEQADSHLGGILSMKVKLQHNNKRNCCFSKFSYFVAITVLQKCCAHGCNRIKCSFEEFLFKYQLSSPIPNFFLDLELILQFYQGKHVLTKII